MKYLLIVVGHGWLFYGTVVSVMLGLSPEAELLGGKQVITLAWFGFYIIPSLILYGIASAIDSSARRVK